MDIRVLRYFLAVAQEESITKAAESLHIAQPSLSKQMMELSKQLLIRGSRKTALTVDGVLLRRRAEEIVELLDRTERELSAGIQTVSGEIAIGGGATHKINFSGFPKKALDKSKAQLYNTTNLQVR